ncbi:HIT family protein [Paenibacillus silviterrae]|uniref:HIT family protein n=1 Tax=Paenibacillus silviterrae TaxID=3242194 RepID=UPI002543C0A4|nr:HIT family protein [Paenibacillus chinjuensis]
MECFGCRLANRTIEAQIIYEDEHITCLLDIAPLNEGHTLILPKRHYLDLEELDEQTVQSVYQASIVVSKALKRLYEPDGITVMQNGGRFNDLGHYHMHVFPRYKEDGFGWLEPVNDAADRLKETCRAMTAAVQEVSP